MRRSPVAMDVGAQPHHQSAFGASFAAALLWRLLWGRLLAAAGCCELPSLLRHAELRW